jgi:two-component system, NtrC family, sensor histidine kinase HydH
MGPRFSTGLHRLKAVDTPPGVQALFLELQRYVGFTPEDEARLRAVKPHVLPVFVNTIEAFYARILEHPDARAALERGERQVGHLKTTLLQWLNELFDGPWDDRYVERRARIGVVHVRIGLPQHYMVTAMNLVRRSLLDALEGSAHRDDRAALNRVLDLDLAIMLHTFRLDLEARQIRAERLATFGQLVGSIGHELRNPLGVIATSVYVLKARNESDPKVTKHLDRIGGQVTIANDIITQLLDLIRDRPLHKQRVPLTKLLHDIFGAIEKPTGLALELPTGELPELLGDPTQLRQVLMNLIENAVLAASPSGRVVVDVTSQASTVVIGVEDTGPGIDPAIASRLFEPLVTTRPKGIGLGLALVKRIVERHGGTVETVRGTLGGARFVVRLEETP